MADYIVYRSGANTVARNTSTGTDQFTNTSASSVFNSCLSTLNTAGTGGSVYVKRGTYDISTVITLFNNIQIVGEERDSVILNNTGSGRIMSKTGSQLQNFKLRNMTLKCASASNTGTVYFAGATRTVIIGNRFWVTTNPTSSSIMFWYDDVNATTTCYYNKIHNNLFEGYTNGQDILGMGSMDWSTISGNTIIGTTDGQGIGVAGTKYATFADNTFRDTGNIIGLEGNGPSDVYPSQGNTITGNTGYNCSRIKLSEIGTNNKSIHNVVVGNHLIYGTAGIEDGNGYGDIISDNIIARTNLLGIEGTFDRCIIKNNLISNTNYTNGTVSVGGSNYKRGGIALRNNTANMPTPTGTVVQGNKIHRSGGTFINEPDGTSKSGHCGGLLIDSNYVNVSIINNNLDNCETDIIRNHGTTTINRDNDQI